MEKEKLEQNLREVVMNMTNLSKTKGRVQWTGIEDSGELLKPWSVCHHFYILLFKIGEGMFQNPLAQILPPDQADLVLVMIVSIPLSYLLSLIYNKYLFLTLSMSLTIGFQSFLFPNDKWVLWIQQQVIYLLVIFSPRKYVGHIVIIECFTVLVFMHLRRLYLYYG